MRLSSAYFKLSLPLTDASCGPQIIELETCMEAGTGQGCASVYRGPSNLRWKAPLWSPAAQNDPSATQIAAARTEMTSCRSVGDVGTFHESPNQAGTAW